MLEVLDATTLLYSKLLHQELLSEERPAWKIKKIPGWHYKHINSFDCILLSWWWASADEIRTFLVWPLSPTFFSIGLIGFPCIFLIRSLSVWSWGVVHLPKTSKIRSWTSKKVWQILLYSSTWKSEEWMTTIHIHWWLRFYLADHAEVEPIHSEESTSLLSATLATLQVMNSFYSNNCQMDQVGGCHICWHLDIYGSMWSWRVFNSEHKLSHNLTCLSVCWTWVVAATLA